MNPIKLSKHKTELQDFAIYIYFGISVNKKVRLNLLLQVIPPNKNSDGPMPFNSSCEILNFSQVLKMKFLTTEQNLKGCFIVSVLISWDKQACVAINLYLDR